ncbi:hypothetical protein M426DRAFT_12416 [Hypoxylon sp. CI-4A]|nr:hypothetical protein M426DRAFT_12416 [Hypoxylon sp. CI-4A]
MAPTTPKTPKNNASVEPPSSATSSTKSLKSPGDGTNALINFMATMNGIEPPGPDAYSEEPESITEEQRIWMIQLIRDRDAADGTNTAADFGLAEAQYSCPDCGKEFRTQRTLNQHVNQVHIGTECFWPGCGQTVGSEALMNDHLKEHNQARAAADGQPGDRVTCRWPNCNKVYSLPEQVARHLRQHNIKTREEQQAAQPQADQ